MGGVTPRGSPGAQCPPEVLHRERQAEDEPHRQKELRHGRPTAQASGRPDVYLEGEGRFGDADRKSEGNLHGGDLHPKQDTEPALPALPAKE